MDGDLIGGKMYPLVGNKLDVKIRHGVIKDITSIFEFDNIHDDMWTEDDFKKFRKSNESLFLIAEAGKCCVGYVCGFLKENKIHLINLAVSTLLRRQYIGTQLIDHVKRSFMRGKHTIYTEIDERNLVGQLFLKSLEFKATTTMHKFFGAYDGILMEFCPFL